MTDVVCYTVAFAILSHLPPEVGIDFTFKGSPEIVSPLTLTLVKSLSRFHSLT